jgi:hypothetical protein
MDSTPGIIDPNDSYSEDDEEFYTTQISETTSYAVHLEEAISSKKFSTMQEIHDESYKQVRDKEFPKERKSATHATVDIYQDLEKRSKRVTLNIDTLAQLEESTYKYGNRTMNRR